MDDPEAVKRALDELCAEAGVAVLLHALVCAADRDRLARLRYLAHLAGAATRYGHAGTPAACMARGGRAGAAEVRRILRAQDALIDPAEMPLAGGGLTGPMLTRLAPFLFVLLWSSSFVAAKTGLRHLSPLLFVAIRLAACAAVLVALMLVLRRSWRPLGGRRWLHCAIAGALMNGVGLMGPHVGLLRAPAAQIALVQSLTPLLTAALGVALLREPLRTNQWLGLALGLAGVGLVVGQAALESAARFDGLLFACIGVVGLVAGTLYFGRFCRGVPLLPGAAAQFVSAAVVAALCAWLLETPRATWTGATIAAVAWNTVMVSLGGMGLYFAMLARGTAARTTANFYLVPGTAAVLAWGLLGERLTPLAAVGLIVAAAGCWLVNATPAIAASQPAKERKTSARWRARAKLR